MLEWGRSLKILLVFSLLLFPFVLSMVNCSQAAQIDHIGVTAQHFVKSNDVFIAGDFHQFNVTLSTDAKKVSIVAYHGNVIPDANSRNQGNYYRWECEDGVWKDASGHDSTYIDTSKCGKINNTYSFYISISKKANPGGWTVKIFVDNKEVSSNSLNVIIGDFCLFFSTIVVVFESYIKNRNFLVLRKM